MTDIRAFLAIEMSAAAQAGLRRLQERLRRDERGIRWIPVEQLHLTVKFLGSVPTKLLPDLFTTLTRIAASCEPFDLQFGGAGCLPPHGPVRIVWAGLDESTGRLAAFQTRCETELAQLGFAAETRAFTPHITIARVKDHLLAREIRARVASHPAPSRLAMSVSEFVLFESQLSPKGPTYVPLSRHKLGP